MTVYIAWAFFLVVYNLVLLTHLPSAYMYLAGVTLVTMVFTVVGVFFGVAFTVPASPFTFLGFYAVANAYVWLLAVAWTPMPAASDPRGGDDEEPAPPARHRPEPGSSGSSGSGGSGGGQRQVRSRQVPGLDDDDMEGGGVGGGNPFRDDFKPDDRRDIL